MKKFREPQKGEETTGEESAGTCRVYPLFSPLPQGLLLFPLLPLQGVEKRPRKGLQKKKKIRFLGCAYLDGKIKLVHL